MVDPNAVAVGDFVEAPAAASVPRGVYRVVGTPDDDLVCLRLTDETHRRTNTGDLVRVGPDAANALERAREPRPSPRTLLRNATQGPYWMLRSLLPF